MSELESGFRLGDVLALVRRQFLVVLVAALLGAVLAYFVYGSAPTRYSATARVEVGPNPLDTAPNGTAKDPVMETEKDLVKRDSVAEAVRKELRVSGDNRSILQHVTVTTTEKSFVLQITYEAATADDARDGANASADGYLAARRTQVAASRDRRLAGFDAQIKDLLGQQKQAQDAVTATAAGTTERTAAQSALAQFNSQLSQVQTSRSDLAAIDLDSLGSVVRRAPDHPAQLKSKATLGKAVGVFGLLLLVGLALAWLLDRRNTLGGGRKGVEQILPGAGSRVMPAAQGRNASPAQVDTAIDRLAVELVAGGGAGTASSVLVIGASDEPPVALAEELASSLTFAGIPALFVLAGSTDRELRHAHTVTSFADLLAGPSVSGPASLADEAGRVVTSPTVTWLRPRGSAEASGLLRRTVVETLVARAGREHFETVVFVAAAPSRTAAGTALGQWVGRTTLVVGPGERSRAEAAATALADAGVRVSEVVWT